MISKALLGVSGLSILVCIQPTLVLSQPQCHHDPDQPQELASEILPYDPQQKIIQALTDSSCKAGSNTHFDPDEDLFGFLQSRRSVPADDEPAALACALSKRLFTNSHQYVDESTDSTEYFDNIKDYWTKTCFLRPKCIVKPSDTTQVRQLLKTISISQASFAVRSGGHNGNPGFASIDHNGVLIDLVNLNRIELSKDKKTVKLGPGNRWGDVYNFLDKNGVTVVGGRAPEIGVGGFLLGGGLSYFSSSAGLGCDMIRSFELVLANSTVINVNREENQELFKALKGGGPNFGIVTQFELYTVVQPKIWFQTSLYNISKSSALLQAISKTQVLAEKDPKAALSSYFMNSSILINLMYAASQPSPSVFEAFYSIPQLVAIAPPTIGTHGQLVNTSKSVLPPARYVSRSIATKIDEALFREIYAAYCDIQDDLKLSTDGDASLAFTIQPISRNLVRQGDENGGNAFKISPESQQWTSAVISWNDKAFDAIVQETLIHFINTIKDLANAKGLYVPFIYLNDANVAQDYLSAYGAQNLKKLKALSVSYDPTRVFQKLQNSGFLLDR